MKCETCKMKRVCDELERMGKVPKHEKCRCYSPAKPITNANKIRAMTDEELAVWIAETSCCSDWCILRDACDKKQEHECCINVWLDWLKQEATDD